MENIKTKPVLRFPEFDGEWKMKPISSVLKIGSGKDYKHLGEGDIPVFGTGGLMTRVNDFLYDGETVCIGRKGTIDKPMFYRGKLWTVDTLFYTHSFTQASPKFIYNIFQRINWKEYNEASGVPSLSKSTIEKIDISLPSLPEQQKIATFLTSVDEKLTQLNKKKSLLVQHKKGAMQQIFSQQLRFKDDNGNEYPEWEEKRLGEIARIYDGTHQTPNYQEQGIPFYSVEHVMSNNFTNTKFITVEVFEKENEKVKLERGDILMTKIGNIGTPKYIDWDVNASFYVSLALIKKSNNNNNEYISHAIRSDFFQLELHKRTIHVAFPQKINLGEIGECLIWVPSLPEQTKIANFLSALDEKIAHCGGQIEKMEQWKKGLLQGMFC